MRVDPNLLLIPAVALLMGGIAWDLGTQSVADREATAVPAEIFADVYGVRVGITVDLPEDREVTGAEITLGERRHRAWLYPLDGTWLLVEGTLVDVCRGGSALPVMTVTSTAEGDHRTDRYTLEDDAAYRDAVSRWCGRGVQVIASGSRPPEEAYAEAR
jgi:hypothetical protein